MKGELAGTQDTLHATIVELRRSNMELRAQNDALRASHSELQRRNDELARAASDLGDLAQKAYLLRLADDIRPIPDARQKIVVAMRLLAQHLGVNRAEYFEIDPTGKFAAALGGWAHDTPTLPPRFRVDDFALDALRACATGKAFVVPDSTDPSIGAVERAAYEKLGIRSAAGVPIIKNAQPRVVLALLHGKARAWARDDLAIIEETAERVWAAVERAHADTALARSAEQYRALFETMDEACCIVEKCDDATPAVDFRWIECNAAFVALTGWSDLTGKSVRGSFTEDAAAVIDTLAKVLRIGKAVNFERPVCDSGWILKGHAFRFGGHVPAQVAVLFQDVTEHRAAERRQNFLTNELNHRVKNNLAIVQAVAAQTFQGAACKARLTTFEARLMALATVHDVLTGEKWNGAEVGEITRSALAIWASGADPRIRIRGEPLRLRSTAALALAMALHELATNASKYGALSRPHGRIDIRWEVTSGPHRFFRMSWQERGGPSVRRPSRRGFGSWLIETGLARDLGGKVELAFEAKGVRCNVVAPLAGVRESAR